MLDHKLYTVGWICAVEAELVAVMELLDEEEDGPVDAPLSDNNTYTLGRIGKHNVVIAALPSGQYGTTSAASVARDMVRSFPNIRIGLMVGIGGGVPTKHDVRLGDVVVSSPNRRDGGVIQYDYGKAIQGQGLLIKGSLNQPPTSILTAMTKLRAIQTRRGHNLEKTVQSVLAKNERLLNEYQRPPLETDKLYKPDFVHVTPGETCSLVCDEAKVIPRSPRSSKEDSHKVHYGLIASGNQVMKDAIVRDKLAVDEEVLCFEMEAAGLNNHFPCVVIRGICDYSDSHKNDAWQGFAAMMAAAYAKELLLQISPQKVEAERKIEELLADVCEPILEMSEKVGALDLRWKREDELKILDWISKFDYTSQQHQFIQQRQLHTGQWFLECENLQTWLHSPGTILHCPGMPGAGKTIIAATTIEYLRSELDQRAGLAYVYCNYQKRSQQTTRNLLASLLRQLAQSISPLPDVVTSLYLTRNHGSQPAAMQEIIETLHAVVNMCTGAFIVIDALDELEATDSCQSTFVSEIRRLRDQTMANILISSRPRQRSKQMLEPCLTQEIYAHEEDLILYVDQRLADMPVLGDDNPDLPEKGKDELKNAIREGVIQAVKGVFLAAPMFMENLKERTTANQILTTLRQFRIGPGAYNDAYDKTMVQIRNQSPEQRELARRALIWMAFAKRPLTLLELQYALSVRPGIDALGERDLQNINQIDHVTMGLIRTERPSNSVTLLHHTTLNYFRANPGSLLFSGDQTLTRIELNGTALKQIHLEITKTCDAYRYLAFPVFEAGRRYKNSKDRRKHRDLYPLSRYVIRNLTYHAIMAGLVNPARLHSRAYATLSSPYI
ncbi:purine uridine phosphorylase [Fusarium pseudocircinatum]|uniref:Purine uridine phosphorylase n=1 Tax=Fusarium pseudocircinatum TaxID=56676 RepID=A0A8H5NRH1_9HYPO|nr:purine uridine phosphorylase [Fusarium pseudocircinatum]